MWNWFLIELAGLGDVIRGLFAYIFPEYPYAGVLAALFAAVLFLFYALKSGFAEGLKIGLAALGILTILLFSAHQLAKLFGTH